MFRVRRAASSSLLVWADLPVSFAPASGQTSLHQQLSLPVQQFLRASSRKHLSAAHKLVPSEEGLSLSALPQDGHSGWLDSKVPLCQERRKLSRPQSEPFVCAG